MKEKREWRAFAELLIGEVKKHPEVWKLRTNHDRRQKDAAWEEICNVVVENFSQQTEEQRRVTVKEIANKWKSYRDAHLKYLRKKRGQYIYGDLLRFLEENGCFKRRRLRWASGKNPATQEDDSFEEDHEDSTEYPMEFIKTEFPPEWTEHQNHSSSSQYSNIPCSSLPPELTYTNFGYHLRTEKSEPEKLENFEENEKPFVAQPNKLISESPRNMNNSQWPLNSEINTNHSEECAKSESHRIFTQKRPLEDAEHQKKDIVLVDEDQHDVPVVQPASSNSAAEDDDDMFFFKSLLPAVKELNKSTKLSFRIQVLQVLQNLSNNT